MTPQVEDLVQSGAPATKPANQGSYWEFVAIPIRNYRLLLLCSVLWCGFQTGRSYLAVPTYTSSATFRDFRTDRIPTGLAQLAEFAGLRALTPTANYSIEFYLHIMRSRSVLDQIISKTYELSDGSRATLPDLLNVGRMSDNEERRIREARGRIRQSIHTERLRGAGLVRVEVTTRWPEVSYAIAQGLVEALNSFRSAVSQEVAHAEKAFISEQLTGLRAEVVAWEDSLQTFLAANRLVMDHSELFFTRSRILAELEQRRNLHTDLTRAYMEASINAVRETPSLLVTSYPRLPTLSRQEEFDFRNLVAPLLSGVFAGMVLAVAWEWVRRNWDYDNPTVDAVREAWPRLTSVFFLRKWFWPQAGRGS